MDEVTRSIQEVSRYMLFGDDKVLVNETRSEVNAKLEIWWEYGSVHQTTRTTQIALLVKWRDRTA